MIKFDFLLLLKIIHIPAHRLKINFGNTLPVLTQLRSSYLIVGSGTFGQRLINPSTAIPFSKDYEAFFFLAPFLVLPVENQA